MHGQQNVKKRIAYVKSIKSNIISQTNITINNMPHL